MSELSAKDFLRLVRMARGRANPEIERLKSLRERAGYGTGRKEATRISGTNQVSRVADNVCAMVDLEAEMAKKRPDIKRGGSPELIDYAALRYEAMQTIDRIPRYSYKQVLMHYYIEGLTWPEVAKVMGRSLRGTQSLNGHALEVFKWVRKRYHDT